MATGIREYDLPKDLAELRFIEVTGPTGYKEWTFEKMGMNSPSYRAIRVSTTAAGSGQDSLAPVGTILYDILGPNNLGRQRMVLASFPPAALVLKLWYTRAVPDFSIPKDITEFLATFLAPYLSSIISYASKSLLRLEDTGIAKEWEKDWREDLRRTVSAAADRSEADPEVVEEFGAGEL
jgi:hypothetical protein